MDLSTTAQFLGIVYTIAATIAAIAATIGATVSIRNRIINRRAAASASAAEVSSAATSVSVEAMKKRTDDLFTALLRDQSQEKELEEHGKTLGVHEDALEDHDRRLRNIEGYLRSLERERVRQAVPAPTSPMQTNEGAMT